MKRKQLDDASDDDPLQSQEVTPRKRRTPRTPRFKDVASNIEIPASSPADSPSMRLRTRSKQATSILPDPDVSAAASSTPKSKSRSKPLFGTPTKLKTPQKTANGTPSRKYAADRSARRKSAKILFDEDQDDIWDVEHNLAREILGVDDEAAEEELGEAEEGLLADGKKAADQTPRRGRTKGSKNRRSPTPEGDIPPHERFFFQNRPGPVNTSNNTLAKLPLLTHEEYFSQLENYRDPSLEQREYLLELHERSFPQWRFELSESFNICLHGYGSKRKLVQRFADWLCESQPESLIVVVNGYTPTVTLRSILATIIEAALGEDAPDKLGTQPGEVLELLQTILSTNPPPRPITVLINSIDALTLRRPSQQAILARLAKLPYINMLVTADTPNFLLLWDVTLRDEFNFVFHDCTTFAPYDVELDVVGEVHQLFGRKARRVGGRQGVGFVLKSLPENTRKLYRLLITEILTILGDQDGSDDEDGGADPSQAERGNSGKSSDAAIEWQTLFNKAAEEFISSSEMMFRTQLKEFYDHQMITSKTDPSGAEMLGVPLSREEMEGVLEELVLAQ